MYVYNYNYIYIIHTYYMYKYTINTQSTHIIPTNSCICNFWYTTIVGTCGPSWDCKRRLKSAMVPDWHVIVKAICLCDNFSYNVQSCCLVWNPRIACPLGKPSKCRQYPPFQLLTSPYFLISSPLYPHDFYLSHSDWFLSLSWFLLFHTIAG